MRPWRISPISPRLTLLPTKGRWPLWYEPLVICQIQITAKAQSPGIRTQQRADAQEAKQHASLARQMFAAGHWQEAVQSWSKVISTCPYNVEMRLERAQAYRAAGLIDSALSDLTRVMKLRPGAVSVLLLLAEMQLVAGDLEAATKAIKDCLKTDHDNKQCAAKVRCFDARLG
jgi:Flp pilus assembly protein TadD